MATWTEKGELFCHSEAESQAAILFTLNGKNLDEFIFTAFYPTLTHIYQNSKIEMKPFRDMVGWDT